MNELDKLIDSLIVSLNNNDIIKELKNNYDIVKNDKELINKIDKYYLTYNSSLKEEINNNVNIKNVRKSEAELAYLILEINNVLKDINPDSRSCL